MSDALPSGTDGATQEALTPGDEHRAGRDAEDRPMLQTESNWFGRLVESIVADFPHLRSHVRDCVDRTVATFAGAKIRTYLPILIDRKVRLVLRGRTGPEEAVGPGAGPVPAPRHGGLITGDVRMTG